ncbi:unnamed protein product [Bursaphelenchus okinawaensis]|uniref:Uncharacterized protein n=1 Tax=Bursaphelenchus okinawaensis TaxID=465554 RepID=A0A811KUB0_9BILA|nr:unnamed protein product [Bursaphelenchus okinawaensis]CAG9112300.1 unnamed protein product [Bursaphelenchus okinawaensis]
MDSGRKVHWRDASASEETVTRIQTDDYTVDNTRLLHTTTKTHPCCHIVLLVLLVTVFSVSVFFIQCFLYVLYTLIAKFLNSSFNLPVNQTV